MRLISGSSNYALAEQIGQRLNIPLVETQLEQFANGEKRVWVKEKLDGQDVVIVQSFSNPVDSEIMEFLLLADAVERLGARDVHVIIPWMGYSLQDKVFRDGEPIAAKVVANLVSSAYVRRVYLLDLHNNSIPGFFAVPTAHLSAIDMFIADVKQQFADQDLVVASPDFGGLKRARTFAGLLNAPLVNVDKHRDLKTGEVTAVGLHGEVEGKTVILFDDVIMGGGTVVETSELLKKEGAVSTHFYSTHGVFAGSAIEKITSSTIDSVIITNSIRQEKLPKVIRTLDLSPLLATTLEEWL